jgi:Protein of unknown function (DUF2905)
MAPLRELARSLVILGVVLVALGGLLFFAARSGGLPFRIGRLPGDIVYRGRHGTFYFPIVTSIVLSVALTLLLWIVNAFRR